MEDYRNAIHEDGTCIEFQSSESSGEYIILDNGGSIDLGAEPQGHFVITYTGAVTPPNADATVTVNDVIYRIANENIPPESFVWDYDNGQGGRHVFTVIGETIYRNADGVDFAVTWDGTGSFIFTITFGIELSSSVVFSSESSSSSSS